MVKGRRRQLGILGLLAAAAVVSLYYGLGSHPGAPAKKSEASGAKTSFELEDVPPIDLARIDRAHDAAKSHAGGESEFDGEVRETHVKAVPTPLPTPPPPGPTSGTGEGAAAAVPSLPPMNLRYLGAVQVPEGGWVAALVTDRKELLTGKEGEVIANRFRIVKIGVESIDLLETASGRQRRIKMGASS